MQGSQRNPLTGQAATILPHALPLLLTPGEAGASPFRFRVKGAATAVAVETAALPLRRSSGAPASDDPFSRNAATRSAPATCMHLVRTSHDVGADPGDERFPNRTKAAARAPASMRAARAIPIVPHGARHTDQRDRLGRQRDRTTRGRGRTKAIVRTAAAGRSRLGDSASAERS